LQLLTAVGDRQVEYRAVGEHVSPRLGHRLQLDQALDRSTALTEQVPQCGRERRTGCSGVPAEPVCLEPAQHSTEALVPLADGDLVAQLGQADRTGETGEAGPDDNHSSHQIALLPVAGSPRFSRQALNLA
jgi:hypothetical protein